MNCRATWCALHWSINDSLAQIMADTAATEIHQWAWNEKMKPMVLPMRFRQACSRMAKHLRQFAQEQLEKVA
jgi:hypothetical protein